MTSNNVVVGDLLPTDIIFVSSTVNGVVTTPTSNAAVASGTQLTWNVGQLLANQTGQIVITTLAGTGLAT